MPSARAKLSMVLEAEEVGAPPPPPPPPPLPLPPDAAGGPDAAPAPLPRNIDGGTGARSADCVSECRCAEGRGVAIPLLWVSGRGGRSATAAAVGSGSGWLAGWPGRCRAGAQRRDEFPATVTRSEGEPTTTNDQSIDTSLQTELALHAARRDQSMATHRITHFDRLSTVSLRKSDQHRGEHSDEMNEKKKIRIWVGARRANATKNQRPIFVLPWLLVLCWLLACVKPRRRSADDKRKMCMRVPCLCFGGDAAARRHKAREGDG